MQRNAIVVIKSARQQGTFIAIGREWLVEVIDRELQEIHDCCIAEINGDSRIISKLECEVDFIID